MEKTTEELLERPYRIIDFLPEQVPADSGGQFFAVEKYFLDKERLSEIKKKHARLILKLNCYYGISADGETDLSPAQIAERICARHTCIRIGGTLITSEPDDTYMTVYNPGKRMLALIRKLASGEGLYLRRPGR